MNQIKIILISMAMALPMQMMAKKAVQDNSYRLWYQAPAKHWLEALPIGNSHLGGMVYGGALDENIQLNEETFWSGGPYQNKMTGNTVSRLMTDFERDRILESAGFELLRVSFSDIRDMSEGEFVESVLHNKFDAAEAYCGFNYTFGKNGSGSSETLASLCKPLGISVFVSGEVLSRGEQVSSSAIRRYIENGEIERANEMLGYFFGFCSPVFSGDHRGRLLGAPTINQYLPERLVTPKFGVYHQFYLIVLHQLFQNKCFLFHFFYQF